MIGILMIVFASLALLFQLVGYLLAMDSLSRLNTAVFVLQVIGLPITCVQLLAGIACVRYRRFGPQLALCYATISLLHTMVMAATIAATTKGDLRPGYFVVNVIYLAWPIVAGVLITRPSSKAACSS